MTRFYIFEQRVYNIHPQTKVYFNYFYVFINYSLHMFIGLFQSIYSGLIRSEFHLTLSTFETKEPTDLSILQCTWNKDFLLRIYIVKDYILILVCIKYQSI